MSSPTGTCRFCGEQLPIGVVHCERCSRDQDPGSGGTGARTTATSLGRARYSLRCPRAAEVPEHASGTRPDVCAYCEAVNESRVLEGRPEGAGKPTPDVTCFPRWPVNGGGGVEAWAPGDAQGGLEHDTDTHPDEA